MSRGFVTHRCAGSLANHMGIRWYPQAPWWALVRWEPDWDGDPSRYYVETIATIHVCPWCGKRLDEPFDGEYSEFQKKLAIDVAMFREGKANGTDDDRCR